MMSQNDNDRAQLLSALEWHLAHGADDLWLNEPVDRTALPSITQSVKEISKTQADKPSKTFAADIQQVSAENNNNKFILGTHEAIAAAQALADQCDTLEKLKLAIADFDGLSIRQTASNMVFADGNVNANVMVIGEAPAAEDDIQGRPFIGEDGTLLDKILACVSLDRRSDEVNKAVYLSNILNWRPPGNRSPTSSEMAISLPFIKKHIELAQPKIILLCGGATAQSLLDKKETISKLRGHFYDYEMASGTVVPALVTYHPAYLLKTPMQKRAVWSDMLMFQEKLESL